MVILKVSLILAIALAVLVALVLLIINLIIGLMPVWIILLIAGAIGFVLAWIEEQKEPFK